MLYERDGYQLYRGDSLRLLAATPAESVDAVVTDPPYGIALQLNTRPDGRRRIAGDGRAEARRLWERWVPEAWRVARPDTAHVVFGTWKSPWMLDVLSAHFAVKGCICWDKRRIGIGFHLRTRWELAYFCVKGKPPRRSKSESDLWECSRPHRPRHVCEKPVDLLRRAVRLVTDPGMLVMDPFAGIFSTGVAAVLEGRRFVGGEIDPAYWRLGCDRLDAAAAATPT